MVSAGSQTLMYGLKIGFTLVAAAISGPIGTQCGRKKVLSSVHCSVSRFWKPDDARYLAAAAARAVMGMALGFLAQFYIPY